MADYSELKRLAEGATHSKWSTSGSYVAPTREDALGTIYVEDWCSIALVPGERNREFIAAANPAAVLALIAQVEALQGLYRMHQETETRAMRDLKLETQALRKDAERYRWLRDGASVILTQSVGFTAESGSRIYSSMPTQRELDSAIDAAMNKDAGQ